MRGLFLARLGNDVKISQYMSWLIPTRVPKKIIVIELGRTEQEKIRGLMSQSIDQKLDSGSTLLWPFTNEVGCTTYIGTSFYRLRRSLLGP